MSLPLTIEDEINSINDLINNIREIFIMLLESSISTSKTNGSCIYACFLTKALVERYFEYTCKYRGGDGANDGYYITSDGIKHGHYWLEIEGEITCYIVDITADQFGDKPTVILPLLKADNYRAGN